MKKEEYIKNLKKVKVVLGNGFDLHCGLHTKYSDYYCQNYKKFVFIQTEYKKYLNDDDYELDFNGELISQLNVWDVFFALNSSNNPKECKQRWCDIEKMMLRSLSKNEKVETDEVDVITLSKISWESIKECIVYGRQELNHVDRFVVAFCKLKMELKHVHPNDFYLFLLSELKNFEKSFGEFIYHQLHISWYERCNYGQSTFLNGAYIDMAIDTLNDLCGEENLVGIDSFNYSYIHTEKMMTLIQHINGSWKNPIFGVDTIFEPREEPFMFTKTSRRIDSDLFNASVDLKPDFENLVVFGHSLNEADYSYFFPVFDKLHLTDSLASNVVVFAYSIYDAKKEAELKTALRKSISDILYAYAISKNLSDPKRFLDSLSTQKRIITYEIPQLKRNEYSVSLIDQEWENLYKAIDDLKENER